MCVCISIYTQPYAFKLILFLLPPLPSILVFLDCQLSGSDAVPVLMHLVLRGK